MLLLFLNEDSCKFIIHLISELQSPLVKSRPGCTFSHSPVSSRTPQMVLPQQTGFNACAMAKSRWKNNEKSIEKQQLSSVFSFGFEKGFFFLVLNFLALGRHSVAEARAARCQKASRNSITFMTESGLIQKFRNSINYMSFYSLSIVCAPFLF